MARPICVHCGQAFGQRHTEHLTIKYPEGQSKPPYRGNGIVVKETEWRTGAGSGTINGVNFGPTEIVLHRWVWDGESYWGGYEPFCKLRCALEYARKAYAGNKQPCLKAVG
jgi:hypothetical protein